MLEQQLASSRRRSYTWVHPHSDFSSSRFCNRVWIILRVISRWFRLRTLENLRHRHHQEHSAADKHGGKRFIGKKIRENSRNTGGGAWYKGAGLCVMGWGLRGTRRTTPLGTGRRKRLAGRWLQRRPSANQRRAPCPSSAAGTDPEPPTPGNRTGSHLHFWDQKSPGSVLL